MLVLKNIFTSFYTEDYYFNQIYIPENALEMNVVCILH